MKSNFKCIAGQLMYCVQVALLLVSGIVIAFSQYRTPSVEVTFRVLMLSECAWTTYGAWRMGYLGKTAPQIRAAAVKRSGRVTSGPFEQIVILMSFIAAAVLAFA